MEFTKIIFELLPADWEQNIYSKVRYVLIDLKDDCDEYKTAKETVKSQKPSVSTGKVQRVQHPYAFLSYMVTKEYLSEKVNAVSKINLIMY